MKGLQAAGGKLVNFYVVLGEYYYVGIVEAPNEAVALAFMAALGSGGNVRTTTMKAFTKEQFAEIIKNVR